MTGDEDGTVSGAMFRDDGSIQTAMEFRLEQLEARTTSVLRDTDRLDAFMSNTRFFVTAFGFVVVSIAGAIGWFGYKSVEDITADAREAVNIELSRRLSDAAGEGKTLTGLAEDVANARALHDEYAGLLESLSISRDAGDLGSIDPHFAFRQVTEMQDKSEHTAKDRRTALAYLNSIIVAGENGVAEPDLLFNAANAANGLSMRAEATKLATLCEYWQPSLDNRILRLEMAHLFGVSYSFDGNSLRQSEMSAEQVRETAWSEMLQSIRQTPRVASELIYSRAWNVAKRHGVSGYFDDLIDAIEESAAGELPLTSYAYAILAESYAKRGAVGWREDYLSAADRGIAALADESPYATWYSNAVAEFSNTAQRVGESDTILQWMTERGIDTDNVKTSR